jgi:hypothetical protein
LQKKIVVHFVVCFSLFFENIDFDRVRSENAEKRTTREQGGVWGAERENHRLTTAVCEGYN